MRADLSIILSLHDAEPYLARLVKALVEMSQSLELPDGDEARFEILAMDERSRDYLTDLFRPYNRRLFEFLGEDWGWPS